jgi:hypothetical protein
VKPDSVSLTDSALESLLPLAVPAPVLLLLLLLLPMADRGVGTDWCLPEPESEAERGSCALGEPADCSAGIDWESQPSGQPLLVPLDGSGCGEAATLPTCTGAAGAAGGTGWALAFPPPAFPPASVSVDSAPAPAAPAPAAAAAPG